jgi:cell wall-associated NlpC family hydrolase
LTSPLVRPQTSVRTGDARRYAVIEEAREWLRTPYHHMARVKGAGADCLTLLAEVYERAGVTPRVEVPFYPPDWNLHRDAERYSLRPRGSLWRRQPSAPAGRCCRL